MYNLISFWLYHAIEYFIIFCYSCLYQKSATTLGDLPDCLPRLGIFHHIRQRCVIEYSLRCNMVTGRRRNDAAAHCVCMQSCLCCDKFRGREVGCFSVVLDGLGWGWGLPPGALHLPQHGCPSWVYFLFSAHVSFNSTSAGHTSGLDPSAGGIVTIGGDFRILRIGNGHWGHWRISLGLLVMTIAYVSV